SFVRLSDTGRAETVGGVSGNVYELVYTDNNDQERMVEVVMTDNTTLANMTNELLDVAQTLHAVVSNDGQEAIQKLAQEIHVRKLGLIRFGNDLRLQRLDTAAVPE